MTPEEIALKYPASYHHIWISPEGTLLKHEGAQFDDSQVQKLAVAQMDSLVQSTLQELNASVPVGKTIYYPGVNVLVKGLMGFYDYYIQRTSTSEICWSLVDRNEHYNALHSEIQLNNSSTVSEENDEQGNEIQPLD